MSMETGDIVAGQYRLEDLLGRGGMGAVYRATHVGLAETVAVKVVQLPAGQPDAVEDTFMKRFEREARVAFQLRHPNAVRVLDYGEYEGAPYLVMEYLEGRPLADELADGRGVEPLERAVEIAGKIAEVLVVMHDQSLVHRDLKPENVMLIEEEQGGVRPVLVDFGLAYLADSETLGRVTQGGEVLGTPQYIAPEQGRGAPDIGPAADIYAFGCVLFEMLSGSVPFPEGSPSEMVGKHMYVPAPSVRERAGDGGSTIPERMEWLVEAMLEKEADDRPTAEQVRAELGAIQSGEGDRARGRPSKFLQDRADRAVDERGGGEGERGPELEVDEEVIVGIVGEVRDDWRVSLGSAGFECREVGSVAEAAEVDVLFIRDADVESVERFEGAVAILAGCDTSDFEASTALLQTAAMDVVPQPVGPSELVKKAAGVWRKVRRRES